MKRRVSVAAAFPALLLLIAAAAAVAVAAAEQSRSISMTIVDPQLPSPAAFGQKQRGADRGVSSPYFTNDALNELNPSDFNPLLAASSGAQGKDAGMQAITNAVQRQSLPSARAQSANQFDWSADGAGASSTLHTWSATFAMPMIDDIKTGFLLAAGSPPYQEVGSNAIMFAASESDAHAARSFPAIASVQKVSTGAKLSPDIEHWAEQNSNVQDDKSFRLSARTFSGAAERVVVQLGNEQKVASACTFSSASASKVSATCDKSSISPASASLALAAHPAVMFVEAPQRLKLRNFYAKRILEEGLATSGGASSTISSNLDGSGETVGVSDSGIDWDNCFFADASGNVPAQSFNTFNSNKKISMYWYQTDGSTCGATGGNNCGDGQDDTAGHGTHVAGTVAGYANHQTSTSSITKQNGVAPAAKLFFQDISVTGQGLNPPDDLNNLFQPAYNDGVRVHTNSWGCAGDADSPYACNKYTTSAMEVDEFMSNNQEMLILFAAGNDGQLADMSTVGSPATCKNCISVGATEVTTAGFVDTINYMNFYGKLCPGSSCCSSSCSANDCCSSSSSSSCCSSKYTAPSYQSANVAAFSSRGPTLYDRRFKPDFMAPGDSIASAKSDGSAASGGAYECSPPSSSYSSSSTAGQAVTLLSGTSMASPALAGAAALVRQYLRSSSSSHIYTVVGGSKPIANPDAALIKAIFAAGAVTPNGKYYGSYQNGQDLPTYSPNPVSGYGLPVLGDALPFTGGSKGLALAVGNSISSSSPSYSFQLTVPASSSVSTKISLAWTDKPGNPLAGRQLVNDLDLVVEVGGNYMFGNGGEQADSVNNLETVLLGSSTSSRTVRISVRGIHVQSSQPFALAVSGPSGISLSATQFTPQSTGRWGSSPTFTSMSSSQMQGVCGNIRGTIQIYKINFPWSRIAGQNSEWQVMFFYRLGNAMQMSATSLLNLGDSSTMAVWCNVAPTTSTTFAVETQENVLKRMKEAAENNGSPLYTDPYLREADWSSFKSVETQTSSDPAPRFQGSTFLSFFCYTLLACATWVAANI